MHCPLPVDWLEYLEGEQPSELSLHLASCLSCRLLVDELQRAERVDLSSGIYPGAASWPRWSTSKTVTPSMGDIYLSNGYEHIMEDAGPLVMLLVISNTWHENERMWCEVLPLSTDFENATSLDFLLSRSATTLDVPFRVSLRYQTTAEASTLLTRIAALTDEGRTVLHDVLEGRASLDVFGSTLEGPHDLRWQLPHDTATVVRRLGERYAATLESDPPPDQRTTAIFMFKRSSVQPSSREPLSLAAATSAPMEEHRWSVDLAPDGRISGRVEHDVSTDILFFVIEEIEVPNDTTLEGRQVAITLWSQNLTGPVTSERFLPSKGRRISIAQGLDVLRAQIDRLELTVSHDE